MYSLHLQYRYRYLLRVAAKQHFLNFAKPELITNFDGKQIAKINSDFRKIPKNFAKF